MTENRKLPAVRVWPSALTALAVLTVISVALGALLGVAAGVVVALAGLLLLALFSLRQLALLCEWVEEGQPRRLAGLPAAGMWRRLFVQLHEQAQQGREERARLNRALIRFREASEALPAGIIALSGLDCIESMNQRAANHFGLEVRKDVGVSLLALVRDERLLRQIELADQAGAAPLVFHSPRVPDLRLQVQVVSFGGRLKLVISRDVTQLEKLETMRRDFVANVSHELRSPLTVVCGFLETLLDCGDTLAPDERHRYLRLTLEHSERMRHLIDDLLMLSALETTGQQDETVPLAPLLESVLEETRALSDGRHTVSLHSDAPEGAALVGSARELRSAFSNLASNAVRYTPAGGQVTMRWTHCGEGGGCFSVEDTGIGIEAAHIPRLTERFFRVDSSRSRETGGTGLGLAIVKHILSRHQARLEVASEPGRGSRFAVILPEFRCRARPENAPQEDVAQDDDDD